MEVKAVSAIILIWIVFRLLKIVFAHWCRIASANNHMKSYKWLWIIMPNWRYYLLLPYKATHKYSFRYTNYYWKPNRRQLWKTNN